MTDFDCKINEIAQHVWDHFSQEDKDYIAGIPERYDMIDLHSTLGRNIRNDYFLWSEDHPLSAPWYADPKSHVIDGIDHHPNHPDATSMKVLERLWDFAHDQS